MMNSPEQNPLIVITAERGGGKTGCIKRTISFLERNGIPYTGFYAEGIWSGKERHSFTLNIMPEGEQIPLCDRTTESWIPYGRFRYNPAALHKGARTVERARPGVIIVMDEIGLQELSGRVWSETFDRALLKKDNPMIVSIQRQYLGAIMKKWDLKRAHIYDGNRYDWNDSWPDIVEFLHNFSIDSFHV